jgi:hypothetical protein
VTELEDNFPHFDSLCSNSEGFARVHKSQMPGRLGNFSGST